jgi:hypothetical protein
MPKGRVSEVSLSTLGVRGTRVRLEWIPFAGCPLSEMSKILRHWHLGIAISLLATIPAWPQQAPNDDLANESIEDLMNIEVISASKKEEKISQNAAKDTQGGLVLAGGGGTSNSTNRYIL